MHLKVFGAITLLLWRVTINGWKWLSGLTFWKHWQKKSYVENIVILFMQKNQNLLVFEHIMILLYMLYAYCTQAILLKRRLHTLFLQQFFAFDLGQKHCCIQIYQKLEIINFITTLTPGRFQSYLFPYFSIPIKMEISSFILEYNQKTWFDVKLLMHSRFQHFLSKFNCPLCKTFTKCWCFNNLTSNHVYWLYSKMNDEIFILIGAIHTFISLKEIEKKGYFENWQIRCLHE